MVANVMLRVFSRSFLTTIARPLEMVYVDGADDQMVCALKGLTIRELATIRVSVGSKAMSASSEIS
jgi:hypothetical protein